MSLEDLQKSIEKHRRRVKDTKYVEAQRELSEQLYPLLAALVEEIGEHIHGVEERVNEVDEQLVNLIEATSSILQPELATQILGTFSIARSLADAAEAGADTTQIITALREALALTEMAVKESTIDTSEGEDEGDEGEDEGEEEAPAAPAGEPKPEVK